MNLFEQAFARQEAQESGFNWLAHYQEVATLTKGLSQHDPRFGPVLLTLSEMDQAYSDSDVTAFVAASGRIKEIMDGKEPAHEQPTLPL